MPRPPGQASVPLIVGVPGSGRTLVRQQLEAHPELAEIEQADVADLEELARERPEARIVHVIRDGRGVAASRRRHSPAAGEQDCAPVAAEWRDSIWRARRAAARLPHYTEVRYEDLVEQPEHLLRELCDFLELDFAPDMLCVPERAAERSWRELLSEHEVARCERFAGGTLAQEGYPPYERRTAPGSSFGPLADTRTAMKVVLGTRSLITLGGVATYALTVARELERLGHDVTVVAEDLGVAAEALSDRGIRVANLDDAPPTRDAVIAHDLPMAAMLAAKYPNARRVFVVHGDHWDLGLPPLVPGLVHAVVACSDRFAARARALPLEAPIIRLREPIDTDAHLFTKTLPDRPRRALIVSNYLQGERRRMLVDAWAGAGIECVQAGTPGEVVLDLGSAFASADIVVAKGRAALDGMCAGCAVYVYDQYGGDGWVTPDNYPALEADHFAGQANPRPRTGADLVADLAGYSPEMGVANHELVRTHHGARHHAIEIVAILRGEYVRGPDQVDVTAEVARLARASGRAEIRSAELWQRMKVAEARAADAETRAAEAQRELGDARYLLETKRVRAGLALGRAADRLRART